MLLLFNALEGVQRRFPYNSAVFGWFTALIAKSHSFRQWSPHSALKTQDIPFSLQIRCPNSKFPCCTHTYTWACHWACQFSQLSPWRRAKEVGRGEWINDSVTCHPSRGDGGVCALYRVRYLYIHTYIYINFFKIFFPKNNKIFIYIYIYLFI